MLTLYFLKKYKNLTDEALMKRLQNHDTKALEVIYERYYKKLYFFCLKMLNNNSETANDVIQDVFLRLLQSPDKFNVHQKFKSWIYTVTANDCRKTYRAKSFEKIDDTITEKIISITEQEEDLSLFMKQLNERLMQVSDRHRETFILKYNENFSLQEIADIQKCALGTVKSRLHYTTKYLAENLHQYKSILKSFNHD